MADEIDPWGDRKRLTFEQAEGASPIPSQLELRVISQELRAVLWRVVHDSLQKSRFVPMHSKRASLSDPWDSILRTAHTFRDHRMIDEFEENADIQIQNIKNIFINGDYLEVLGWLQFVFRNKPPYGFARTIDSALRLCKAAYRVLNEDTIVPFGSDEELKSLKQAFADLENSEFHGARAHLQKAAQLLTEGNYADSVRESIHSVESVARTLESSGKFSEALARLSNKTEIHGSMKAGFQKLYGYTSDENGIRHPLLDDGTATTDETDATFMIGACSSFVSYLINKSRSAGLL